MCAVSVPRPAAIVSLLRLLFGFSERVTPRTYAIAGFTLGALKVGVDAAFMGALFFGPRLGTPFHYLAPLHVYLGPMVREGAQWWQLVLLFWTLPFLWIGVSMTARRAVDAGGSPWLGILFFVPYVNYALMLILCLLPSKSGARWDAAIRSPGGMRPFGPLFVIVLVTSGVGLGLALLHSLVLQRYGMALFLGVPFTTGALAGYLANRGAPRSLLGTMLVALLSQVAVAAGLLVVAVEGLVCLLMALPFGFVIACLGAFLGREIARRRPESPALATLLLIALPASDAFMPAPQPVSGIVRTSIEIAAPPEVVWRHVVSFSELPPPRQWLFHLGVAYPVRARIAGRGVGAVRRCEFSTGAFVEPITAWDEPRRLAFDVTAAPIPMEEWSPYRKVYAAHLDAGFRSRRGEFRLIELPGGRTRLEGRTWYALDIHPAWYWGLYVDAIVHTIHDRVLSHIRTLAEAEAMRLAERSGPASAPQLDPVGRVP